MSDTIRCEKCERNTPGDDRCYKCGKPKGELRQSREDVVSDYWRDYYCDRHCTLCGNSGIIDTTGVRTAAGVHVGRRNFCVCPNGQWMREHRCENLEPNKHY